jgi:hypothetical protein
VANFSPPKRDHNFNTWHHTQLIPLKKRVDFLSLFTALKGIKFQVVEALLAYISFQKPRFDDVRKAFNQNEDLELKIVCC